MEGCFSRRLSGAKPGIIMAEISKGGQLITSEIIAAEAITRLGRDTHWMELDLHVSVHRVLTRSCGQAVP